MTEIAPPTNQLPTTAEPLAELVKPDPHKLGRAWWRLKHSDRPVWTIILHFYTDSAIADPVLAPPALVTEIADDLGVPDQDVRAALAYYAAHRRLIDAALTLTTDGALP